MTQKKTKTQAQTLVVGAGLSGAVIARRLAEEKNESMLVIDRREQIGGNCFDQKIEGITIHRYGAHIFHTDDQQVWTWLSRFTCWHEYRHQVQAQLRDQLIFLPFNLNALEQCFAPEKVTLMKKTLKQHFASGQKVTILQLRQIQDPVLQELADYVYEHIFLHYTLKQWECRLEDLDMSVAARVPVVFDRDDHYFANRYQAIPAQGYTAMIEKILDHPLVQVRLDTDYQSLKNQVFRHVYFTGAIDEFGDYCFGPLPYRSLEFVNQKLDQEYYQAVSVVNYPETQEFTRIIEHKHFLAEKTPYTWITREYPRCFVLGQGERYYPIQNQANQELYRRYRDHLASHQDITFLGRLGDYQYYDMDKAVARALNLELR